MQIFSFLNKLFCAFFLMAIMSNAYSNVHATKLNDGKIIQIIKVLDNNEIAAADVVTKSQIEDKQVLDYAKFLHEEHSKNLDEAIQLVGTLKVNAQSSKISKHLEKKGKEELNTLNKTKKDKLANVYIMAMIKDHKMAIDLINNKLLKDSTSPDLVTFLKNTSSHIQEHLKAAEKIKNEMK